MSNNDNKKHVFTITLEDLQNEASQRIGRKLKDVEIELATKGLESGLTFDIESVYDAIFNEVLKNWEH